MPHPVFLAVGHDGIKMTSPDGRAWSTPVRGKDGEVLRGAAVGNGRVVAIGTHGSDQILTSSADGTKWEVAKRDGGYSSYLRSLIFDGTRFVGLGGDPGTVGAAGPHVMFSRDGATWDGPHAILGKFMLRRVAFGDGVYVGVGDRGRRARSKDAKTWEDVPNTKPLETLVDVAFGNGVFVGVGLHGLRWRTKDGLEWTDRQLGEEGEHLNAVVWTGDRFVAVGQGATFASPDGLKWTRTPNRDAPTVVCYSRETKTFLGARWKGRLQISDDGATWTEVARAGAHIEAVAAGMLG